MTSVIRVLFFLVIICEVCICSQVSNSTRKRTIRRKLYSYGPKYCCVTFKDIRKNIIQDPSLPMIYFVTPTYPRPEQIPELVRLSQTLMHVPRLYWIVADDRRLCSESVAKLLQRTGLPYTHISSPKPIRTKGSWLPEDYHRGVANRRAGLKWIRKFQKKGILYFGDDDKTYDLELFNEIRKTKKVSMFPVGLTGLLGVTAPMVKNGKVIAFFSSSPKKYPIDMAGFALNISYLKNSTLMPYSGGPSANSFLNYAGVSFEDIEPLADNCTKVLVWHTQSLKFPQRELRGNLLSVAHSRYENLAPLLGSLHQDSVVKMSPKFGDNGSITLNGIVIDNLANL